MVKAIFFDIDGTLVSFKTHKIPASTQEALKALRDKSIKIFIATGRPQCLINNLGDLEFDGYITVNGSYCLRMKASLSTSSITSFNLLTCSKLTATITICFGVLV